MEKRTMNDERSGEEMREQHITPDQSPGKDIADQIMAKNEKLKKMERLLEEERQKARKLSDSELITRLRNLHITHNQVVVMEKACKAELLSRITKA